MMMSKQPISKENLEFNSRLLNLLMSEIANFVKTFDFRDIPYINFAHFLSEILENESEINDSVILSISNKLNSYIKDHILSLGEDLDIKEFFNQRGIHINKEYVNCNNDLKFDRYYIIDVRFIYKGSLLVNKFKYDNFVTDTFLVRYKELVINCFGVIVRSIVSTEIARIKKELELERVSKEMIKIK